MSNLLFPALTKPAGATPFDASKARVIKGDGTGILSVPGLTALDEVRVAGIVLPRYVEQEFPADLESKTLVRQNRPLWDVAEGEDGGPILVRSGASNDGIWQKGVEITVVGDWEPDPEPEQPKAEGGQTPPGPNK